MQFTRVMVTTQRAIRDILGQVLAHFLCAFDFVREQVVSPEHEQTMRKTDLTWCIPAIDASMQSSEDNLKACVHLEIYYTY